MVFTKLSGKKRIIEIFVKNKKPKTKKKKQNTKFLI